MDKFLGNKDYKGNIVNEPNEFGFEIGQNYKVECGSLNGIIEIIGIANNGCYFSVINAEFGDITQNQSFEFNSQYHKSITRVYRHKINGKFFTEKEMKEIYDSPLHTKVRNMFRALRSKEAKIIDGENAQELLENFKTMNHD